MSSLAHLLSDVDGSVRRGSAEERARTLSRITDLLVHGARGLTEEHVALFDSVIQRFAAAIEIRARVELAGRLATLPNAPPGTMLTLANDEILVARPVLAGSPRLDDQALMAIALDRGRDHMLAICERPTLSVSVTDVLISRGDGVVRHAVVGNQGARFSPLGTASLIGHARRDAALCELLRERTDLSPLETRQIIEIAKEAAQRRMMATLPGARTDIAGAVERSAAGIGGSVTSRRDYEGALAAMRIMLAGRELTEADLLGFAEAGDVDKVISALSSMTGLPITSLERIFEERDNDLLIVIGKARGWGWETVGPLLGLRDASLKGTIRFRRAQDMFNGLAPETAFRVLHFVKLRETKAARPAAGAVRAA